MLLSEQLGIRRGVTAIIGSGGKTTMLHVLARELRIQGRVILTTSTHILPSEEFPCLDSPSSEQLMTALQRSGVVCVGTMTAGGKLASCMLPFEELETLADYVLVEADGSKRLPLKVHAAHEPVIPQNAKTVVCVIGAGGLGKPVCECVHRPELFCEMTGAAPEAPATPELVADVLNREALADRYYINQCEVPEQAALAARLAGLLQRPTVCGSLQRDYGGIDKCVRRQSVER